MQLYPGWTARDNYAANAKKKKKKRDKNSDGGIYKFMLIDYS
jgi:transcription factor 7-like 2